MKTFNEDLQKILTLLQKNINFSFSKYADGEYAILRNEYIRNCDNWVFNPETDKKYFDELMWSFTFNDPGYYVGISCPCCVPDEHVKWMRETITVDDNHLTWANLFVNNNYIDFKNLFIPEFGKHDIILVANESATISNLPFKIEEHIKVSGTAWKDNFNLINDLTERGYNNKLFLFAAGPLGNMLSARMWKQNKNNTYLDIGSTLNPWLTTTNRGYLRGADTINKVCIW